MSDNRDAQAVHWRPILNPERLMANPNYRFQKQQREQKKLKAQQEKARKKLARNAPETTPSTAPPQEQPT
jgi:hypothetical protein